MEFQKNIHMNFQIVREKIGICRFFLNWSGFEPIYELTLKNSCVRRKHRIKILKTVCTRYCNYLVHTVFRIPIYNTGPVKKFFETKSKKKH